jgi:hypothetical protein
MLSTQLELFPLATSLRAAWRDANRASLWKVKAELMRDRIPHAGSDYQALAVPELGTRYIKA